MPTNKGTALPLPRLIACPTLLFRPLPEASLRPAQLPVLLELSLPCHSSPTHRDCQVDPEPTKDGPTPGSQAASSELSHSACIHFLSWVFSEFSDSKNVFMIQPSFFWPWSPEPSLLQL